MRNLLPVLAFAAFASPALASSIEPVASGTAGENSIETVRCLDCPPLKEKPKSESYFVQPIEPGTQKVEIREESGERKMYRTEAWFGGSPVVFVSKLPDEPVTAPQTETAGAEDAAEDMEMAGDAIDREATTSALHRGAAADAMAANAAAAAGSRQFDSSSFELRLN
ncbi:MAG: plant virulence effector HPE1-like domain-containing protein [Shinella sp.]|nr:plant virulence effector HPE1-like domain-containing protein [Shinella sp.]